MSRFTLMENLPDLVIASTTTVTMASSYLGKSTRITVGGQQLLYTSTTTINFATTGLNALDTGTIAANTLYYIYAVKSTGGVAGLVASTAAPATGPTGYTAWKEIARCRTLSSAATLAVITNKVGGTSAGAAVSEWASYSTTIFGGQTGGTQTARWRRVGSSMELEATIDSPSAWGIYQDVTLPTGYTINTSSLTLSKTAVGTALTRVNNSSAWYAGSVTVASTTTVRPGGAGTQVDMWAASISNPAAYTANQGSTSIHVTVPIAEWAGLYT